MKRVSSMARDEWLNGRYGSIERTLRAPTSPRGSDPDLLAFGEYVVEWLTKRESLLADDWDRQLVVDDEMRRSLVHLFNEQSRLLADQERALKKRVRAELTGIFLVLLGTLISGFAGA